MKQRGMFIRDAKLFKRGFLSALVLAALFFALCGLAALSFSGGTGGDGAISVMLVDEDGSVASRFAIGVVKDQQLMESALSIDTARRGAAMDSLEAGECAAVIILPEGYLEAIMRGRECRGEIILSPAAALHADVVEKIARAGEILMAAGQYGVFAGEDIIREKGLNSVYDDYLTQSNLSLLNAAVGAFDDYFTMRTLDYEDTGMSLMAHYGLCWLVLLLGLCVMFFRRLLTEDLSLLPRLRACGVSDGAYMLYKILLPSLFRLVLIGLAAWMLCRMDGSAPALWSALPAIFAALLVTVWESALVMSLGSSAGAVSALTNFAGLFLCGGLIPRSMLPSALLLLARLTPFGAVRGLLAPLLGGSLGFLECAAALVYAAAATLLIRRRLRLALVGGNEA